MSVSGSNGKRGHNVSKGKQGFQPVVHKTVTPTPNVAPANGIPANPYVSHPDETSLVNTAQRFAVANTIFRPNYKEINDLHALRRKYFQAVNSEDSEGMAAVADEIKKFSSGTEDIKFDPSLVVEGKCGIDGCTFPAKGGMSPDHYASVGCKSGRANHCTCGACF